MSAIRVCTSRRLTLHLTKLSTWLYIRAMTTSMMSAAATGHSEADFRFHFLSRCTVVESLTVPTSITPLA